MKPGRELDALVAEKVMGAQPKRVAIGTSDDGKSAACVEDPINGPFYSEEQIRNWVESTGKALGYKLGHWEFHRPYSTDIAAAWEVVEKIKDAVKGTDGTFKIQWDKHDNGWDCYWDHEDLICGVMTSHGRTAPHAICLAALKAVGQETP